jgi:hypothetical protein
MWKKTGEWTSGVKEAMKMHNSHFYIAISNKWIELGRIL